MIKFYHERLNMGLYEEMLPILKASMEEVYLAKDNKTLANSMKLDTIIDSKVDFKFFLEKEKQGFLNISTMRSDGKLVGHFVCILYYHAQSKDLLIAKTQNVHVLKEYRGRNSIRFIEFNENLLKKRGVKQHYFAVNPALKTDKLLEKLGFTLDEIVYSKGI